MNKYTLWLSWRLLWQGARVQMTVLIAFLGLVIGVASLFVAMSVMSGFETTLKNAVIDVTGDLMVLRRGNQIEDPEVFGKKIKDEVPELQSSMAFLFLEAIASHKGALSGVMIQGVDSKALKSTLGLENRVEQGEVDLDSEDSTKSVSALLGRELAKRFNLKIGDEFKVVVPVADGFNPSEFTRKLITLRLKGVLDLGKYEYNERYILIDLKAAQDLAQVGNRYHGLILKLNDSDKARDVSMRLSQSLGFPYWVRDWRDINGNLFQAVKIEKAVIFCVFLIMILAASMNVSSSLFVNVIQKYPEISMLKAIGLSKRKILWVFSLQGLCIGSLGLAFGLTLGFILSRLFLWAQSEFGLIPGSVYKLDMIYVQYRFTDLLAVSLVTLAVCMIASFIPARRGAKLEAAQGLKYE